MSGDFAATCKNLFTQDSRFYNSGQTFIVDVPHDFRLAFLGLDPVDPHVDDASPGLDDLGLDQVDDSRSADYNVGPRREILQFFWGRVSVAQDHRRFHPRQLVSVVRMQDHRHREPHVLRPAADHDVFAGRLDVGSLQELDHAQSRGGDERVHVEGELPDVLDMEAVDVLAGVHRVADVPLAHAFRDRQLDQNTVDFGVLVVLLDLRDDLLFGSCLWEHDGVAVDSHLLGHQHFAVDILLASGVFTDENGDQAGAPLPLLDPLLDLRLQFLLEVTGNFFPIDDLGLCAVKIYYNLVAKRLAV
jgi:hypothetical protein